MNAEQAYAHVKTLLEDVKPATFYDLPSVERAKKWDEINAAMEQYLTLPPPVTRSEREKLLWKVTALRDTVLLNSWLADKFYQRVEEGATFTQLDEGIEYWSMGLDFHTPEWRTCSALIGLITADYRTSDLKKGEERDLHVERSRRN